MGYIWKTELSQFSGIFFSNLMHSTSQVFQYYYLYHPRGLIQKTPKTV